MNPAQGIQPEVTAQTFPVVDDPDPESVFNYLETASSRAGIEAATEKLKVGKVGIVGLGGTGSYILDLVAKTPVHEIHLFDGDEFLQHNAFRSPGAPSREELAEAVNKTVYWRDRYAPMRKGIVAHPEPITEENAGQLTLMDFVFISIDQGEIKLIVQQLESAGTSFIDVARASSRYALWVASSGRPPARQPRGCMFTRKAVFRSSRGRSITPTDAISKSPI